MYYATDYEKLVDDENILFIDLRSEKEFQKETIPNSINMPILTTAEHTEVSILYVRGNHEYAKEKAIAYAGKKLASYFRFISESSRKKKVVLFCARGGYRSTVLFHMLKSLHENVYKLKKGYKGYRQYIIRQLDEEIHRFQFVNINGFTGCGKTDILKELRKTHQILDLEHLANHRGSLLGQVGKGKQPSQKMFESLLFETLHSFQKPLVFVESESSKIGNIYLPKALVRKYQSSQEQILIRSSLTDRIKRIRQEYIKDDGSIEDIFRAFETLSRYISEERLQKFREKILQQKVDEVIEELILTYYDKNYAIKRKNFRYELDNKNSKETAKKIAALYGDSLP